MKFYSSVIEGNNSNQFELFKAVEKMLNLKAPSKLPSHDCATDLVNRFADFFTEKVQGRVVRKPVNVTPGLNVN